MGVLGPSYRRGSFSSEPLRLKTKHGGMGIKVETLLRMILLITSKTYQVTVEIFSRHRDYRPLNQYPTYIEPLVASVSRAGK